MSLSCAVSLNSFSFTSSFDNDWSSNLQVSLYSIIHKKIAGNFSIILFQCVKIREMAHQPDMLHDTYCIARPGTSSALFLFIWFQAATNIFLQPGSNSSPVFLFLQPPNRYSPRHGRRSWLLSDVVRYLPHPVMANFDR